MLRSRQLTRTLLSAMAVATVAAIVVPPMLLASTTVIGPTQVSTGDQWNRTHRFPAVAYDSLNDIYLITWGLKPVSGRFIDANGNPVGNTFQISQSGTDPAATRVAYSPEADAFLVVWLNENPFRVLGRLMRYSNGTPQFLTNTATGTADEFQIAQPGGLHLESAPTLAYSPVAQEFLVTWTDFHNVYGQKVDTTGRFRGSQITIAATADFEAYADVAYNSIQHEYFVIFWNEPGGALNVSGQRVGTGESAGLIGGRTTILSGVEKYPQVAYDSSRNQYLVITWHDASNDDVYGRLVSGVNGEAIGAAIALGATGNFEGGDGIGLTYSAAADVYFGVFQYSAPGNDEIWGVEVSGDGVPQTPIQVTTTGTRLAYQPQIAPSTRQGRLLAVAGFQSGNVGSQLLEVAGSGASPPTPTPTPTPTPAPTPATVALTFTKRGSGTVTATGISCGTDCSESFAPGTRVRNAATPSAGYVFAGWYGDADCLDGEVVMDAARSCGAQFNRILTTTSNRRAVDLSADGAGDQFLYNNATGDWFTAHNDQSSDFTYTQGQWDAGWEVKPAKLNNDNLADLFLYNRTTGGWVQAINDGAAGFTYTSGTWSPAWNVYIGRLDSDGVDDVLLYNQTTGVMFECLTNGAGGFKTYYRDTWESGWSIFVARLDSFNVDDLFLYNESTGQWTRKFSNGDGTFLSNSGSWDTGWAVRVADMNGDSKDDVFLYNTTSGVWVQCLNTVTGFNYKSGQWSPGWNVFVANMNTDARDELFLYSSLNGLWFQAYPDGNGDFSRYVSGRWSADWSVHVTELNADGVDDLLLYNRSAGWWFKCIVNPLGDFSTYTSGTWSADWQLVDR